MNKPKISIITATHYRPDLLARCIKSVQSQTMADYEHIIFSDHCPKAAQVYEYFKDDKRIRFFENPKEHAPNHGAVAHNFGINVANSEFICYVGDDNIVLPNHTEHMYNGLLEAQKHDIHVVYTRCHFAMLSKNAENTTIQILKRDINKELYNLDVNDRVFDRWRNDGGKQPDMARLGHTREIAIRVGGWKTWKELGYPNEDGYFMGKLDESGKQLRLNKLFTCVYYARKSCIAEDSKYRNKVLGLKKDQVFVYPELLKQQRIIE